MKVPVNSSFIFLFTLLQKKYTLVYYSGLSLNGSNVRDKCVAWRLQRKSSRSRAEWTRARVCAPRLDLSGVNPWEKFQRRDLRARIFRRFPAALGVNLLLKCRLLIPGSNCSRRCKRRRKDKKSRRKSATRCVGALQIYFYFLRLLRWKCSKLIDFSRSHWPTSRKVPAFCILKQTHTIAFVHLIWKTKARVEKMRRNAPTCHEQGHATKSFYDHGTKTKIFRAEKDLFKLSQSFSLLFILKHF